MKAQDRRGLKHSAQQRDNAPRASRATKSEIKQMLRAGRLRKLTADEKVHLDRLQMASGEAPRFHTYKSNLYLEMDLGAVKFRGARAALDADEWDEQLFMTVDPLPGQNRYEPAFLAASRNEKYSQNVRKAFAEMHEVVAGLDDRSASAIIYQAIGNDVERMRARMRGDMGMSRRQTITAALEVLIKHGADWDTVVGADERSPGTNRFEAVFEAALLNPAISDHVRLAYARGLDAIKGMPEKEAAALVYSALESIQYRQRNVRHKVDIGNGISLESENAPAFLMEATAMVSSLFASPHRLGRVQESRLHALKEDTIADRLILIGPDKAKIMTHNLTHPDLDIKVFVVQHDWAAAFAKGVDYGSGEWRLPSTNCSFEFRIIDGLGKSHRVIAITATDDGSPEDLILFVEVDGKWATLGPSPKFSGEWVAPPHESDIGIAKAMSAASGRPWEGGLPPELYRFVTAQIRAICIGLEAEIMETEVIRAPHRLNAARAKKGKLPIYDFHSVNLAARKRYPPRLELDPDREIRHKRLHFVRGHWRHYEAHRTWVKWHLRGDPDLGFIDKEYRL